MTGVKPTVLVHGLASPAASKKEAGAMRMSETDIYEYARQLLDAHGDKAEVEAAQMARSCEEQGNNELAQNWRRVEKALRLMRGPNES
jgi:hypothetical protein